MRLILITICRHPHLHSPPNIYTPYHSLSLWPTSHPNYSSPMWTNTSTLRHSIHVFIYLPTTTVSSSHLHTLYHSPSPSAFTFTAARQSSPSPHLHTSQSQHPILLHMPTTTASPSLSPLSLHRIPTIHVLRAILKRQYFSAVTLSRTAKSVCDVPPLPRGDTFLSPPICFRLQTGVVDLPGE